MPAEHLFVYGTLLSGSDNEYARLLAERAPLLGTARVQGRLLNLGAYPGAIPNANQWITGEIHRMEHPELLMTLDEYEGPEFERARVSAQFGDTTIDCWIYWYIGAAQGSPIASGDWRRR